MDVVAAWCGDTMDNGVAGVARRGHTNGTGNRVLYQLTVITVDVTYRTRVGFWGKTEKRRGKENRVVIE